MSKQNDQSKNNWDDEDETEEPRTFRDAYLDAVNQNRPRPRSNDIPPAPTRRPRPRGVPGSARIYEETENDRQETRPRRARQSREEVEARLRQRPRQPIYTRNQAESRDQPPARPRKQPRREPTEDYPYQQQAPARSPHPEPAPPARANPRAPRQYNDYEEYDEYEVIQERRPPQPYRRKHGRTRRAFTTILTGCLGGLITLIVVVAVLAFLILHNTPLGKSLNIGKSPHTQASTQAVPLGGAGEVLIKNQAGNITIAVSTDPKVSNISLNSIKQVQASSDSDANNQFKQIVLTTKTISQKDDPACLTGTCLLINATVPTTASGGLLGGGSSASVDLKITLPASFNSPDPNHPTILSASANAGNITVNSFNGVLNLNGKAGNISIAHTLIFAGTCVQTLHGDITVNQGSFFDLTLPSRTVPCSNTSSDQQHPWFNIKSGVGNVAITLTTDPNKPLSLLLDANTNDGKITGDFGLNITTSNGSDTYHGPLLPNTHPTASLYVAASTGNIELHKQ